MKTNKNFNNIIYKLSIRSILANKRTTITDMCMLQIATNIIILLSYLCRRDNISSKEQMVYYHQDIKAYCTMLIILSVFLIWTVSMLAEQNNIKDLKIIEHFVSDKRTLILIRFVNKICMVIISSVFNVIAYYFVRGILYKDIFYFYRIYSFYICWNCSCLL